jgi:hypothetical protein
VNAKLTENSFVRRVTSHGVGDFAREHLDALFVLVKRDHVVPELIQRSSYLRSEPAEADYGDQLFAL